MQQQQSTGRLMTLSPCACSCSSRRLRKQSRMALGGSCAPLTRSCRWAIAAASACTTRASTPQAGTFRNSFFAHMKCVSGLLERGFTGKLQGELWCLRGQRHYE